MSDSPAKEWLAQLRKTVDIDPLVNVNGSETIFEWWRGSRKVTVYFTEKSIEFIKVWGPDIDSGMEEGMIETHEQAKELLEWLTHN